MTSVSIRPGQEIYGKIRILLSHEKQRRSESGGETPCLLWSVQCILIIWHHLPSTVILVSQISNTTTATTKLFDLLLIYLSPVIANKPYLDIHGHFI